MDEAMGVLQDVQQRDDNLYRVIFQADLVPSAIRKAGTAVQTVTNIDGYGFIQFGGKHYSEDGYAHEAALYPIPFV